MKKRSFFTFSLCLLLVSLSTSVWAISLNEVIRTLERPFQTKTAAKHRIYDYSADFFQQSKIASLNRMQRANGRVEVSFTYENTRTVPDVKFRWQYDQPTTQEIVSDGESMWVYLPENNQVILSNIEQVNRADKNNPMTFLTGLGNLSRDFDINWAVPNEDIDGNYVLEMTPSMPSSLINRLIIVVDRNAVDAYRNRGKEYNPHDDPLAPPPPKQPDLLEFPGLTEDGEGIWFPFLSTTVYDPTGNSTIIEFSDLRVNYGIPDMAFDFIMPAGVNVVRPTGKEMGF